MLKLSGLTLSPNSIFSDLIARDFSTSTLSTAARRPCLIMPTLSQTCSTSGRMWDDMNAVTPLSFASRTILSNSSCIRGSSPPVGSSMMRSGGSCMKARITATLRRLPLDRVPTRRDRSQSNRSASSRTRRQSIPPRRLAAYARLSSPVRLP